MAGIVLKRGADLNQRMVISSFRSGDAVDLTDWTMDCYVRDGDTLIEKLGLEITDAGAGEFYLTSTTTKDWPAKRLSSDLRMTIPDDGQTYSEIFFFDVQEVVTYD